VRRMKVRYKGPLIRAVVPRIGLFERGEVVRVADDVGERLIASGSFERVIEPKKRRKSPRKKVRSIKPPEEKKEEEPKEEVPLPEPPKEEEKAPEVKPWGAKPKEEGEKVEEVISESPPLEGEEKQPDKEG